MLNQVGALVRHPRRQKMVPQLGDLGNSFAHADRNGSANSGAGLRSKDGPHRIEFSARITLRAAWRGDDLDQPSEAKAQRAAEVDFHSRFPPAPLFRRRLGPSPTLDPPYEGSV